MSFSMKLPSKKKAPVKQYGLIIPNKKEDKTKAPMAGVFGLDNDNNEEDAVVSDAQRKKRVGEDAARSFSRKQVDQVHAKALAEDPSVFDYDGVYDDIKSDRRAKAEQKKAVIQKEDRRPKYIQALMEKAKIREVENDRIRERRLLKEREAEDAEFGDKEKLISASYKRKLMEMKRWDEEDARMDKLEAEEDVTKRGSDAMAGFYSNLLTKNIAMGGDESNARSAYTVGKDKSQTTRREDDEDEPVPKKARSETSDRETKSAEDATDRATPTNSADPVASSTRSEAEVREKPGANTTSPAASQPAAPKPSREEVISAAKARYLARKAAQKS
ncbi:TPA: hypothetical protein N0F65_002527 [Lagenidium giganteum]|uniref:Nuclear speckle splicing regulatory protein 1 N-terminal domain-containing protein n=1 Tax=Lagenidium giganteum TaxID=4803 RepID=A0AAV2YL61_9STRA|nr:TPA: hypothetical protein N0F65_002527 [Lagenidium giganteum]